MEKLCIKEDMNKEVGNELPGADEAIKAIAEVTKKK